MNNSANGRIVFTYQGGYGNSVTTIPLGMTTDTDGFLYVCLYDSSSYDGGAVLKVDPR